MQNILKRMIIQKLIRANVWGGKHMPVAFVRKSIPEHYRNTHQGQKELEKTFKLLLNDGWIILLLKKTGKGADAHISLNPRKVSEITQFIENQ